MKFLVLVAVRAGRSDGARGHKNAVFAYRIPAGGQREATWTHAQFEGNGYRQFCVVVKRSLCCTFKFSVCTHVLSMVGYVYCGCTGSVDNRIRIFAELKNTLYLCLYSYQGYSYYGGRKWIASEARLVPMALRGRNTGWV